MPYYAHSGRDPGKADWQGLAEHLRSAAKLAGTFGRRIGIERAACIAGLFHDLGKYTADFQQRLEGKDISVDHSTAGAQVLFDRAAGADKAVAEIIAYGGVDRNHRIGVTVIATDGRLPRGDVDRNVNSADLEYDCGKVASCAEAWIETAASLDVAGSGRVASRAEGGSKQARRPGAARQPHVASRGGADRNFDRSGNESTKYPSPPVRSR